MPIAFSHFLGSVTDPGIDKALIDAFHRAVAAEGVAEAVPARDDSPFAFE